jgi:lipopolysaccharide export system protein LptA
VHGQTPQGNVQKLLPTSDCEGPATALNVTSERMTFDMNIHTFIFKDKVRIRRCDIIIVCDRLHITTDAKGETVEHIIAMGNVHFQQKERHVTAERAEYFDAEQKLVLTGNPRAWDTYKQHELSGAQITIFLQQERMFVKDARMLFQLRETPSKVP